MLIKLLVLLLAFSVFWGATPVAFAQSTPTPTYAENKLKKIDILMGEHSYIGAQLIMSRFSNLPNFQATKKAIDTNTQELSTQIEDFYGKEEAQDFEHLWSGHINSILKYTDGLKTDDDNKKTQALRELQLFTENTANLLSRGNKGMYTIAQNYLSQHVLNEKAVIDAYSERNYDKLYSALHSEFIHAASMTERLR